MAFKLRNGSGPLALSKGMQRMLGPTANHTDPVTGVKTPPTKDENYGKGKGEATISYNPSDNRFYYSSMKESGSQYFKDLKNIPGVNESLDKDLTYTTADPHPTRRTELDKYITGMNTLIKQVGREKENFNKTRNLFAEKLEKNEPYQFSNTKGDRRIEYVLQPGQNVDLSKGQKTAMENLKFTINTYDANTGDFLNSGGTQRLGDIENSKFLTQVAQENSAWRNKTFMAENPTLKTLEKNYPNVYDAQVAKNLVNRKDEE